MLTKILPAGENESMESNQLSFAGERSSRKSRPAIRLVRHSSPRT